MYNTTLYMYTNICACYFYSKTN